MTLTVLLKDEFEKLKDDVHYLIVAHCKYKDISMYDRALKQFQEDINYGQLEEMSYDERFAFLLGFETSLKAIEDAQRDIELFGGRNRRNVCGV